MEDEDGIFWDGEDENELIERIYTAAVNVPLKGEVNLLHGSVAARPESERDGGMVRVKVAPCLKDWEGSREYVRTSMEWMHENCDRDKRKAS